MIVAARRGRSRRRSIGTQHQIADNRRRRNAAQQEHERGNHEAGHVRSDVSIVRCITRSSYSDTRLRRKAFEITETELSVIAALAQIGLIRVPVNGYSTPAATGTPTALYTNARNKF